MANRSLLGRIERLEAAAGSGVIVYEAGDNISEEQQDLFLKEAVGEIRPGTLVVCLRRFGSPAMAPRLIRGPTQTSRHV